MLPERAAARVEEDKERARETACREAVPDTQLGETNIQRRFGTAAPKMSARVHNQKPSPPTPPPKTQGTAIVVIA